MSFRGNPSHSVLVSQLLRRFYVQDVPPALNGIMTYVVPETSLEADAAPQLETSRERNPATSQATGWGPADFS